MASRFVCAPYDRRRGGWWAGPGHVGDRARSQLLPADALEGLVFKVGDVRLVDQRVAAGVDGGRRQAEVEVERSLEHRLEALHVALLVGGRENAAGLDSVDDLR